MATYTESPFGTIGGTNRTETDFGSLDGFRGATSQDFYFVRDNNGRYFVVDTRNRIRYAVAGPGSGSYNAAQILFGDVIDNVFLTGWEEQRVVDAFGGPNQMERVIAGIIPNPLTGEYVSDPQDVVAGDGTHFQAVDHSSAIAYVEELLREFGLEGLLDDVKNWVHQGLSQVEIVQRIRETEQYKERFPGMELRREAGLRAISEQQYMELEAAYRNIMRTSGMPSGFYDTPEDFANFIGHDISPQELEFRVGEGIVAAQNAPQEVRDALHDWYGIQNDLGALAAYYLDPEKGLDAIQREFAAAHIGGAATRTGWESGLEQEQAERLAGIGLQPGQAQQGFTQLAEQHELMRSMPGEVGGSRVTSDEQVGAMFEGDAEQRDRIRRARERRMAAFAGEAVGPHLTQQGMVGLRSA